jgi:hypothetical protein
VRHVFARVNLQSTALAELQRRAPDLSEKAVQVLSGSPENLSLHVSLSAEDSEGRRIASAGSDFGISGPRRGVWHRWHGPPLPDDYEEAARLALFEHRVDLHDIEDGINQMLGRDPTLHRPPRLSWQKLIEAFDEAGLSVTERDLTAAPLTVELAPEVQAELDRL